MFKDWIVEDWLWFALFAAIVIVGMGAMLYNGVVSLEGSGAIVLVLAVLNLIRGVRMVRQGRLDDRKEQD